MSRAGSLLRHPLAISLVAAVFASLLLPQFTREWQDRQKEREVKQSLIGEISVSATTAVRRAVAFVNGRVLAAGGEPGAGRGEVYAGLRNAWLIDRGGAGSKIITYFPALHPCWYSYELVIGDYLGLAVQAPGERDERLSGLRRYLEEGFTKTYGDWRPTVCRSVSDLPPSIVQRFALLTHAIYSEWNDLDMASGTYQFRNLYERLGEALLMGKEAMIASIASSDAEGFSHGVSLRSVLPF